MKNRRKKRGKEKRFNYERKQISPFPHYFSALACLLAVVGGKKVTALERKKGEKES